LRAPGALHTPATVNLLVVTVYPDPNHAKSGRQVVLVGCRYVLGGHWQVYGRAHRGSPMPEVRLAVQPSQVTPRVEIMRHDRCRDWSVDAESSKDILIVVLGSSRPSSGAEGLVVITEHMLPAGHTR
jgi:hypothetical protein